RSEERDELHVSKIVLLHTLTGAGRDIGCIVCIEEVRLDLSGEVFRVQPSIVELVQDVLVEQATTSEHNDSVQIACILAVELLGKPGGADPAADLPLRIPTIESIRQRLSLQELTRWGQIEFGLTELP